MTDVKKVDKNSNRKQYITLDMNLRNKIAGQRRTEQSLSSSNKVKNTFLSVYPYENCIWNTFAIYESKRKQFQEFNKSEILKALKNTNNIVFHSLLRNELNKDFDTLFERFEVNKIIYQSYFTDLKVSLLKFK
jgi:hypothetical protein